MVIYELCMSQLLGMKMKRFVNRCLRLFYSFMIFTGGYWLAQSRWAPIHLGLAVTETPAGVAATFTPFWEVWHLLHAKYFELPLNNEQLVAGAINGLLATLGDPNTRYLSPEAEADARADSEGEMEGIGILVEFVEEQITIVSPLEGSPAEAAGLKTGDILRQVDGVDLAGMDLSQAANLVRGPAGTTVHLVIERDGQSLVFDVQRDVLKIPSVRGEMVAGNLAYIRLSRFAEPTPAELKQLLETLLANDPAGIILDLRGNPGGSLDSVVAIADQFLDEGLVATEKYGDGQEVVFRATAEGLAQQLPLVVLMDGGSASASEVLAGAIQDRQRGLIIGTLSFGKGTVQSWYGLNNGGGVRITVAHWLTPNGHWVHGQGLTPDIVVDPAGDDNDNQLQTAIDYLQNQHDTP